MLLNQDRDVEKNVLSSVIEKRIVLLKRIRQRQFGNKDFERELSADPSTMFV